MFSSISRLWRRGGFETALAREALFGARTARVSTFRESLPRLSMELRRARRYKRPFTVVAVGTGDPRAIWKDQERTGDTVLYMPPPILSTHLVFFLLGSLLRDSVRETDIVTYSAEHHLYVMLLPETGKVEAQHAVNRLSQVIYDRSEVRLRAGIAEFPRDGFTVEDLFSHARHAWKRQIRVGQFPILKEASNV